MSQANEIDLDRLLGIESSAKHAVKEWLDDDGPVSARTNLAMASLAQFFNEPSKCLNCGNELTNEEGDYCNKCWKDSRWCKLHRQWHYGSGH